LPNNPCLGPALLIQIHITEWQCIYISKCAFLLLPQYFVIHMAKYYHS
jgi:hypothetical protein